MSQVVHCPCGETIRGEDEEQLVASVEAHVQEKHPEMVATMTREQIVGMAQEE